MLTATYSPDDNKLRLYASTRLDPETYARVKTAGFKWAPKQELFVAPMWTPSREDFLKSLCGEIEDEDRSLIERAEERAERFGEYSEKRAAESSNAHAAVREIADAIPFGQPILVGHHSEKRARKDAERIHNGMRKAVDLWETSKYWTERAAGAIGHAKYKELPEVRARRIKTIEADKRKREKSTKEAQLFLKMWSTLSDDTKWKAKGGDVPTTKERGLFISNRDHISMCFPLDKYPRQPPASQYEGSKSLWSAIDDGVISAEQARDIAIPIHERQIAWNARWIAHYDNRLAYEKAMLAESGGIETDKTKPEVGGAIRCWASPGHGRGWAYIQKVNKVTVTIHEKASYSERVFRAKMPFDKIKAIMSAAEVTAARAENRLIETDAGVGFYLEDRTPAAAPADAEAGTAPAGKPADGQPDHIEAMKASLKAGVQIVAAPQLFPTPAGIIAQMIERAGIVPGDRVLEPSAGTGELAAGILACPGNAQGGEISLDLVEVNIRLTDALRARFRDRVEVIGIIAMDFLEMSKAACYDRIVMNSPFGNAADIAHIRHAIGLLKPGGRIVALCANGPRQNEKLKPLASSWEVLPAGSFREQGTDISVAMLVIDKPE